MSEEGVPGPAPSRRAWRIFLLAAILAAAALHSARPLWSSDLFWHLSSGRLFLDTWSLPAADPLTYTAGERTWVHHEWLSQVALALAERGLPGTGDLRGLRAVRAALVVAGLLLLFAAARRRFGTDAGLLVVALAWIGLAPNASLRPHLVVWPLAAWVLASLLPSALPSASSPPRAPGVGIGDRRSWPALLAAVVLWVNLHSSALVVPLLLGVYAAGATLDRLTGRAAAWGPARRAAALAALALGACMLQPSGPSLLAYAGITPGTNVRSEEWATLLSAETWRAFPSVLILWVGLAAATLYLGIRERRAWAGRASAGRASAGVELLFPGFWVALGCLALAAQHRRMALFLFVPALFVAPRLIELGRRLAARRPALGRGALAAAAAGALAAAFLALPHALDPRALRAGRFPEQAADFVAAADLEGRLFHDINWGGYLGYRRAPAQRVFADGRWILAGEEAMADYPRLYRRAGSPADIEALYGRYGVEVLVQSTRDVLRLPSPDAGRWRLAWVDPLAAVLIREGPAFAGNVERLCALYRASPEAAERAVWPVRVKRPDGGPSPTDIAPVLALCAP